MQSLMSDHPEVRQAYMNLKQLQDLKLSIQSFPYISMHSAKNILRINQILISITEKLLKLKGQGQDFTFTR